VGERELKIGGNHARSQELIKFNYEIFPLKWKLNFKLCKFNIKQFSFSDLRLLQEFSMFRETFRNVTSILNFDVSDQTNVVHHQERWTTLVWSETSKC
jgi:hypothetical protein